MLSDKEKEEILKLYPEFNSIKEYPISKDGRIRVGFRNSKTKAMTFRQRGKVLLEMKLGRRLVENETVDHDDNDKINDDVSNLKILSREENASKGALKRVIETIPCFQCGVSVKPTKDQVNNRAMGKAGPFCSRHCSGLYGSQVRSKAVNKTTKDFVVKYEHQF